MKMFLFALLLAIAAFAFTRTEGEMEMPDGSPGVVLAVDGDLSLEAMQDQAKAETPVYAESIQEMAAIADEGQILTHIKNESYLQECANPQRAYHLLNFQLADAGGMLPRTANPERAYHSLEFSPAG